MHTGREGPRRTLCAESVQTRHPNDDSSRGAARGADGRRFANGAARGDRPGVPDAGGVGGRRLKTDDTEGRLDALVEAYAPQVTAYARQWGRLTGEPVRAGLFFVRSDVVRWVEDR